MAREAAQRGADVLATFWRKRTQEERQQLLAIQAELIEIRDGKRRTTK